METDEVTVDLHQSSVEMLVLIKSFYFNSTFSFDLSHDAMLRNDVADLYYTLYGRRKPPCLSGAIYQRVVEVPRTAMENAEVIPGIMHHVTITDITTRLLL